MGSLMQMVSCPLQSSAQHLQGPAPFKKAGISTRHCSKVQALGQLRKSAGAVSQCKALKGIVPYSPDELVVGA